MTSAQLLGYPLLLIAVLEFFLGLLLLRQNPRNSSVNKATAACAFAAALWSLSAAFMYIRVSLGLSYLVFARLSWIGWFTVPSALQTVLFLRDESSKRARVAGWVLYPFWSIVLALTLFTDLIVTDGFVPIPFHNSPGPLEMPFRLIGGLTVIWLIVEIIRLKRSVTGTRRAMLGWYLYGTIIFATAGAVIGGFLQLFTGAGMEPSLSSYFSFPWVLMIFYAITRYRLFDIRIVASRLLVILFISLLISTLQFEFFKALGPFIGEVPSIFISIPLLGLLFFGTPFTRTVQSWTDEIMLGSRFAYQKILKDAANAAISILHLDELLYFIVDSVRQGMKVERACLFLCTSEGKYVSRQCFRSIDDPHRDIDLSPAVAVRLAKTPQILIRDELDSSPNREDRLLADTLAIDAVEVLVPIATRGKLLGVLSLGDRTTGEAYLESDLEVLQTLAGHAAIAIENAQLFEEAGRMRASLREQEGIFRTLAQTMPAALFIHRGGKFLYANPASSRVTGYSLEEILNMDFWAVTHPDYRELIANRGRARLEGSEPPPQYEFKIQRKDGTDRWVLMTAGTIEYEGKGGIIGTVFDITDRKRAEEEKDRLFEENARQYRARLKEQERYSAVLRASNEGFWIHSAGLRFEFVNDSYCRMMGYSREEIMGMTILDLDVLENADTIKAHEERLRTRGFDRFETRHRRKDGSLIDLEVMVNYYERDNIFFTFLRDITERRKAEDERMRHQSEKEKILKDLHDGIGGITTNINLLAEIARTSNDLESVKRSLATIAELSRDSLSEIRGFIQSLDTKELTWQAIAAEFRHLGGTIIEPHEVRFAIEISIAESSGAPTSSFTMNLFRIYKEALSNVIKHAKASAVSVSLAVDGRKCALEVQDNGIGVGKKHGKGRGLLNMQARTEEMGGAFSLRTEKGTTLRIEVPIP